MASYNSTHNSKVLRRRNPFSHCKCTRTFLNVYACANFARSYIFVFLSDEGLSGVLNCEVAGFGSIWNKSI